MTIIVESRLVRIVAKASGRSDVDMHSAIDQDLGMFGDDVDELATELRAEFGDVVCEVPWDRFTDRNEPHLFTTFMLLWALIAWSIRGRYAWRRVPDERLTLGHLAAVIQSGRWFEPGEAKP